MRASILNTAWTHVSRKLVWPTLIFPCIHPPTAIGAVSVEFDQTAEAVAGLKTRESKVATTSSLRTLSLSPAVHFQLQLHSTRRIGKDGKDDAIASSTSTGSRGLSVGWCQEGHRIMPPQCAFMLLVDRAQHKLITAVYDR